MAKPQFIRTNKIIAGIILALQVMPAFSSSCLYSKKLNSLDCNSQPTKTNGLDTIEPTFMAYRLAVKGSSERKCRLEPTCSKFLIHAVKHHGLPRGILFGFARAQIKHDDGFGVLPKAINRDDFLIILDPVSNWNFLQ